MSQQEAKPKIPIAAPYPEEEHLQIQVPGVGGAIWAVRIPRFLYDKWLKVDEEGVHLGTLVIDNSTAVPKISLKIPQPDIKPDMKAEPLNSIAGPSNHSFHASGSTGYDVTGLPAIYSLNVPEERAKNTWVFSETKREVSGLRFDGTMIGKRKREKANPTLLGEVKHDCTLNPILDDQYKQVLLQRKLEAAHARRPVIRMEEIETNKGKLNMMSGGWGNVTNKMGGKMVTSSSRLASADKSTRLPKTQVRNILFGLFRQKPYWGIGALRELTAQPDAWLREVLRDVAIRVTEGPYRDLWELNSTWSGTGDGGVKDEAGPSGTGEDGADGEGKPKAEGGEEWDDEDDEEDDFEEVM